jgi:hypothetical protein
MNVEIGAEAAQFPEKEYINGIAFAVLNAAAEHCPPCEGSRGYLSEPPHHSYRQNEAFLSILRFYS